LCPRGAGYLTRSPAGNEQASAEKGDRPAALASLREAVRLDPASARAHYQLALVLRQAGAAREAARHFTEAHRLAPYLPAGPS